MSLFDFLSPVKNSMFTSMIFNIHEYDHITIDDLDEESGGHLTML
jgi:hypothetical protein